MSEIKPPIPSEKPPVELKQIPVVDKGVSDKSSEKAMPSLSTTRSRPFPWPILLAILTPLVVAGILLAPWQQQDHVLLFRIGWISLSAILPGFSLMAVLGGLWQMRRRPVFSSLAILLAGSVTGLCLWLAQKIVESNWIE